MIRHSRRESEPLREELAGLLPPPAGPVPPAGRLETLEEHFMSEITREPSAEPAPPRRRGRRLMLACGLPSAAAAVIAAGVVVGLNKGGSGPAGAAVPAPGAATSASGDLPGTMRRIELVAAHSPQFTEPKPGQFIYTKSLVSWQTNGNDGNGPTTRTWVQKLHLREAWLSAEGKSGWLIEPGYTARGGDKLAGRAAKPSIGNPTYAYLKSLPTDPAALLRRLRAEPSARTKDPVQRTFMTIGNLLTEQIVPPELAVGLYKVAAGIRGVELIKDVTDAAGRHGIAVGRTDEVSGVRTEWIFDGRTYDFLGQQNVQVEPAKRTAVGTVTARVAVLKRAVVDAMKQRPAS